ncbi:hypothetical protein C8Q76DRAFT_472427 [Earliella scabrosa]|nr:hypothetical protein C8Q76DRAFT_472427 [Earliella scabrosa]
MSMSPSTSRRLNDDIFLEILKNLDPFPSHFWDTTRAISNETTANESFLRQRTLASLALTCRSFSEPASRLLWTDLPCGLLPLMRSFSGLRKVPIQRRASSTGESQDCLYYIKGNISSAEIERFEGLAARVRCFATGSTTSLIPGPTFNLVLGKRDSGAGPLFPNLEIVHWQPMGTKAFPQHHRLMEVLCLSRVLSSFSCYQGGCLLADVTALAALRVDLAHLEAPLPYWWDQANHDSMHATLSAFRHLRSLRVLNISGAFFRHLGSLQGLERLEFSIDPYGLDRNAPPPFEGFRSLRTFAILQPDTLENNLKLLSSISSAQLTTVNLAIKRLNVTLLRAIGALSVLQSLVTFRLDIGSYAHPYVTGYPEPMLFSDLATPFYPIRTLEDVTFTATGSISRAVLSNNDLLHAKHAWPHLRTLTVNWADPKSGAQIPPFEWPSLPAVVEFALGTPSLEMLDIEVADVSVEEVDAICARAGALGPDRARQGRLRQITLARGERRATLVVEDAIRLGGALHELFPRLGPRMLRERSAEEMGTDFFRLLQRLHERSSLSSSSAAPR